MLETPSLPWPARRNVALDVLRALAVLLVLGRHLPLPLSDCPATLRPLLTLWQRGGWIGVDLFFVLSGFLIAGLLFVDFQRYGRIDLRTFYVRRGLKIYPAFFLCLACTFLVYPLLGLPFPSRTRVLAEVFFIQCYVPATMWHTWSLAVEEHFYILLPLVLVWLASTSPKRQRGTDLSPSLTLRAGIAATGERDAFGRLWLGYLILAALLLGLRILAAWRQQTFDPYQHLFPTHLRIDSLLLGVVLAQAFHFHRTGLERLVRLWRWPLLATGAVLLAPAFVWPVETTPALYTFGLTVFALGSAALLLGVLFMNWPDIPAVRGLGLLGSHSYSIYLWHIPVLFWGPGLLKRFLGLELGYTGGVLVYLGGSLALGWIMARLVELPVLRLRDRWFPSRTSTPLAEPAAISSNEESLNPTRRNQPCGYSEAVSC